MTCNLNATCGVSYRTYSAYKSHIYRRHSSQLYSSEPTFYNINASCTNNNEQEDVDLPVDSNIIYDDYNNELFYLDNDVLLDLSTYENKEEPARTTASLSSTTVQENPSVSTLDIKKSYTSFIMQLREEFLVPKNTTHVICCYIITLMKCLEVLLEAQAKDIIDDNVCSKASKEKSTNKVIELNVLKGVIKNVCHEIQCITKNEYQFTKSCEEFFSYYPPEEIIVSANDEELEQGYFIPIDKSLSLMLRSQTILTEILRNFQQQRMAVEIDEDLMLSYRDGHFGSRIDDNNLPEQYRSRIDFINLVAICPTKIFKDNMKAKRFLQPIIDNLNQLQVNGLFINGVHIKFSFSTMVADNLAAHLIGGLQLNFNSGYFCRRCYIKYADKNLPILMSKADTRTSTDHDKFIEKMIQNPYESPLMGITRKSTFEQLIGFHPIMSLPGDLMHDFIEGICPLVMMAILKQASSMRLVTYGEI
ncbi:unnamed protein product [Rotaria sordida]|uniref:C2H2-type domain-containing protein n=2 Tax=Rotaria sordida TaxID=392033 RepID=A0A816DNY8_9BILA|nr:unnamed protein product [Rotaria sordida]